MSELSAWIEKNKALWTRVYDEVIKPDIEEEWKASAWVQPYAKCLLTGYRR
jgi:hypothetical protein